MILLGIGIIIRTISYYFNPGHKPFLIKPEKIATTGPYRYIRHPSYLGLLFMIYGFSQFFFGWYKAIPFLYISFLFISRIMLDEEQFLCNMWQYKSYMRKVKYRIIPWIF
jgi:protein-S-isoprenylcysteine O-methyltransferase Ste14